MTAPEDRSSPAGARAGWQRAADELKARPPEPPSSFAQERMLRGITAGPAAAGARTRRPLRWVMGGVVVLAAAAALVVALRRRAGAPEAAVPLIAVVSFEGIGDATAEVAQGGELRTAPGLVANTQIAGARLTAEGGSALRLSSLDPRSVRVALLSGSVRVAFHPSQQGDRVTVRTRDADVTVVGTVFRVELSPDGTRVSVTEGRVRVTDRGGRRQDATPGHDVTVRNGTIASATSAAAANPPASPAPHAHAPLALNVPEPSPAVPTESAREPLPEVSRSPLAREPRNVGRAPQGTAPSGARSGVAPPLPDARPDTTLDPRARLVAARARLERGERDGARAELRSIAAGAGPVGVRVEAWTLLAESHQAAGDDRAAVGLYDRAAGVGRGTAAGANARFAQARLLERRLGDAAGARAAYRRYLGEAPRGALRRSAIEALCRLGDADACTSPAETEGTTP